MSIETSSTVSPVDDEFHERAFAKRRCCFWVPFLNTESSPSGDGSVFWERINPIENDPRAAVFKEEPWWQRGWKRLRGWSEIVAGPKWKTLIRKISKKRSNYGRQGYRKFHYDPMSYALNFDEGPGQNSHYDDDDIAGRGFSTRYSLPPSCKSSLDFDKEGMGLT